MENEEEGSLQEENKVSNNLIVRYLSLYLFSIVVVVLLGWGTCPFSGLIFIIVTITVLMFARLKYIDDGQRYVVYGFSWSILCIILFLILAFASGKVLFIREIIIYPF